MLRPTRFILALVVGVVVGGCAGEKYADKRDEVVEPPTDYGEYNVDGVETDRWCSDFGRESLDRLVRETWEKNLELKAAWARLEQAEAQVDQVRASLFPELSADAGVTVSNGADRLPESVRGQNGNDAAVGTRYEASLAASYEVDLWGKLRKRTEAQELEARAVRADARSLAMTLTSQVAEAWLDAVAARQRVDLLEEQVELSRELLELTEMRFRRGRADELDISQQEQNVESLRGQLVDARLEEATSRHRLAVLTGREPGDDIDVEAEQLPELPPLPDPGVPADLLKRRPDVRRALYRLRAADRQTAAAVADKLPSLQLSASLLAQANQIGRLLDDLIWSATAAASQNLFQGGRLEAAQREAESVAEERLYGYGQTFLEALEDVQNALVSSEHQKKRVASLERERSSAEESLEAARSKYREGTVDYFRVLDALQQLQEIERELLDARRQQLSYRISLCRSLGGSWATNLDSSLESEDD
jgi:NodT family efflux transporter outer membrane factor (OMF) lipoprotein